MDKGLTVTKWDNAPSFAGSLPYESGMPLFAGDYRGYTNWERRVPNGIDFIPNGIGGIIEKRCVADYALAYIQCAPLNAIINKLSQAHANGQLWVLDRNGKSKGKESQKAVANGIRRIMSQPNMLQTQDEFEAQGKIYQKIFGYNVVYAIKPVGFPMHEAEELWNVPASWLDIKLKTDSYVMRGDRKKRNAQIESITLTYGTIRLPLELDNIYIQKDFTPSFETVALPESRIRGVSQQIHNIQAAYASRASLIVDRGAMGILSSAYKDAIGTQAMDPADVEQIQAQSRRYGSNAGQFRFIITKAPLNFSSVGYSTKDLLLFEEIEDDVVALCNAFDYPSRLMGVGKTNALSQSDVEGFNKLLYQDNIIPGSKRDAAFWNRLFDTEDLGVLIEYDFTHLPVLQEDLKQKGDARGSMVDAYSKEWEMGACSINEMRIAVGDDPITKDGNGKPYPEEQNPYYMCKPEYDKYMRENGLVQVVNINTQDNAETISRSEQ